MLEELGGFVRAIDVQDGAVASVLQTEFPAHSGAASALADMPHSPALAALTDRIAPLRQRLSEHALYDRLHGLDDVRMFMQHHVFAVWDFMCLLKGLQRSLTCVELPWRPVGQARIRRLINEIVLEEESDVIDGQETGHFEYYLRAMQQIGADTASIETLLVALRRGLPIDEALQEADAPAGSAAFVRSTFGFLDTGKPHVIAAAFTFGREDSIPVMFRRITAIVARHAHGKSLLSTYLERHLQLDEEDHGPKAVAMLCELCGNDAQKWEEATAAAHEALSARLRFWTTIAQFLSPVGETVELAAG